MELDRTQFLALAWTASMRPRIEAALSREGVAAVSAHQDGRRLTAKHWPDIPDDWGADAVAYCLASPKPAEPVAADAKKNGLSRTAQALALVDQGMPVAKAAEQAGVSIWAVYNARKRRETLPRCPHCGQTIRPTYPASLPASKD